MEGGAWWATVHRVAKSRTRLSDFTSLHCAHKIHKMDSLGGPVVKTLHGSHFLSLVWEDRTCGGATQPLHHNY